MVAVTVDAIAICNDVILLTGCYANNEEGVEECDGWLEQESFGSIWEGMLLDRIINHYTSS